MLIAGQNAIVLDKVCCKAYNVDKTFANMFIFHKQLSADKGRAACNSVFIKLWLDVKHSTLNHYFAFVVN
jgi:predicted acetyltransferase